MCYDKGGRPSSLKFLASQKERKLQRVKQPGGFEIQRTAGKETSQMFSKHFSFPVPQH